MKLRRKAATRSRGTIIDHIERHVGKVGNQSLRDLVATLAIHVVSPTPAHQAYTLVTEGVNTTTHETEFGVVRNELVIKLPASWPVFEAKFFEERYNWPVVWLRLIATQIVGGLVLREGDTVNVGERLAPDVPFTGFLTLEHLELQTLRTHRNEPEISFLELHPVYTEERALAETHGPRALIECFAALDLDFTADPERPSTVSSS